MIEWMLLGVAAAAGLQQGPLATADADSEGLKGPRFVTGGIEFSRVNMTRGRLADGSGFSPGELGSQVVVERAVALGEQLPLFVSLPNAITFGDSFMPGDDAGLGLLASVTISAPGTWRFAGLDVIYEDGPQWRGTEVVLEAFLDGRVVGKTSFTVQGLEEFGARVAGESVLIKAFEFDSLELSARRDGGYAALPIMLDNVFLVAPAPGVPALAGAACAVGARRRRA